MSVTYYKFTKSTTSVYSFSPTLDGTTYTAKIKWNIYGKRYYIHLYTTKGVLVFCRPVVSSAVGVGIDTISWSNGTVTVTTLDDHGYLFGEVIPLNVYGTTPDDYSDVFDCLITGSDTFTYKLDSNPGTCTVPGNVSFDIDLCAGYFDSSRIVYREDNSKFEVWS